MKHDAQGHKGFVSSRAGKPHCVNLSGRNMGMTETCRSPGDGPYEQKNQVASNMAM